MKKLLSVLLTLALCIGLMPLTAVPVHAADFHAHEGWTAWSTTDALPSEAGNYYLTVDVTLSGVQHQAWHAPDGVTNICLEGHTIDWYNSKYPDYNRNIMQVYSGAELHIYDKDDNSGKITGGAATWSGSGYAAYFWNGGGVYIEGGTFYLHGGQITGNGAVAGGGVFVSQNGSFYMSGGIISNNTADNNNWFRAAGVQVESGGTFTMTGGTITGNHGGSNGPSSYVRRWGVFVNAEGTINVSGSPVITGNVGELNVLLAEGRTINVTGALSEDAEIGVITWNKATDGNPITVTSGLSGNGTLSNFVCNQNTWNTDANNAFRLTGGEVEEYYAEPHNVTVTPGENMTKTTDSGAASQTGVIGPMTDVVYTADMGYYFPADYAVASVNGISVTRDSDTQITVSGTPEADTEITLPAAIAIPVVYDLYIGGVQVTEANTSGTGWSYDPSTSTLSLNNYTFTGAGYGEDVSTFTYITGEKHGAIFSKLDDLTISLTGTNTITEAGGAYFSCGIFSTGAVTIDGDGSLSLSGGPSTKNVSNEPSACGVFATSLTLDAKGSVSITAGDNTKKGYSYGIFLQNGLTINQGNVSITAGASADRSYGLSCGDVAINNATVTITAREGYNSYGLYCSSLAVNASDVTVSVSTATNQQRALNVAKTKCSFGAGVTAEVSNNIDGSALMPFADGDINMIKYFKTTYVAPSYYSVTVSAGAGMTLTSGTVSQTGLSGAMTDVVYTANEGYYFPDPYFSAGVTTGVTVTRDSYTQITVSGTPTADTTINLAAATAKTKLPTPAATFALDGDSDLVISGLLDGGTYQIVSPGGSTSSYIVSGTMLTLPDVSEGSYSIILLATGTDANEHIDSDPEEVTITKATAPTGVGKTDCTTTANDDGTITGVDNTMEYQKSGDTTWTAVTGTSVTGLVPDTYSVRVAAAGTALASDAVSVTIAEYTPPKADTPVFTPGSQSFTDSIDVTITCALNGATVYYTDDGSTPSATNGTVTTGAAITLDATKTLKAIAVMTGYDDSDVATATYTKTTPSSGGGSTPAPETYAVTPGSAENGKITVSPENAAEGDKVTVTVTPDEGYELDSLTVKDKDGNEIKVTEKDGVYTFTMPASEVDIEATFKEAEEEPAPADDFPFVDVPEDAYYREAVEWAVETGVTGGTSPTTFSPKKEATRGQTMTFLWAAAGAPEPKTTVNPFKDISEDDYYYKAILWAYENGITAGISAEEFGPEVTVTRAQVATFLYGIAGRPDTGSEPFADVNDGDYFALPVAWAFGEGITSGTSETTFSPDADCLREQIITFMYLYFAE